MRKAIVEKILWAQEEKDDPPVTKLYLALNRSKDVNILCDFAVGLQNWRSIYSVKHNFQ